MNSSRTFVDFGFGAIQGGLFLYEAHRSSHFDRLVVAEVVPEVCAALRAAGCCCHESVATPSSVEVHTVRGLEVYSPAEPNDRARLVDTLAEATEIATALPRMDFMIRATARQHDCLPKRPRATITRRSCWRPRSAGLDAGLIADVDRGLQCRPAANCLRGILEP